MGNHIQCMYTPYYKKTSACTCACIHARAHARTYKNGTEKKNSRRGRPPKIEKIDFKTKIDARSLWFWVNLNARCFTYIRMHT